MMYRLFFLAWFFLAFCVVGPSGALAGAQDRSAKSDYEILRTADQFITGPIGVAASTSGEEAAFRRLVKEPDAPSRCRRLLTEGTPAGQLYGLLGLSQIDPPAFREALPRYRHSKTVVQSMSGCIRINDTAGRMVEEIEKGQLK